MSHQTNRAAAFVEYSKGTSLEDIAHALAIPIDKLTRWHHEESWAMLVPKLPVSVPMIRSEDEAKRAMEKIKTNRERNLAIAQRLQEDLIEVIDKLRTGKLKVKKAFKDRVVEFDPTLRDRCDLALYARNVAEMSYRALGDVAETAKNPHGESGQASAGQITIILPPAVAQPREKQGADGPGGSIDVETVEPERLIQEKPALLAAQEDVQSPALPSESPGFTEGFEGSLDPMIPAN